MQSGSCPDTDAWPERATDPALERVRGSPRMAERTSMGERRVRGFRGCTVRTSRHADACAAVGGRRADLPHVEVVKTRHRHVLLRSGLAGVGDLWCKHPPPLACIGLRAI